MHQPKSVMFPPATYGTVGTSAAVALAQANPVGTRFFLQIQNTHATQDIWFTVDGTTAAVGSGFKLPGGNAASATYDLVVPQNAISIIGSAAGTTYTLAYV